MILVFQDFKTAYRYCRTKAGQTQDAANCYLHGQLIHFSPWTGLQCGRGKRRNFFKVMGYCSEHLRSKRLKRARNCFKIARDLYKPKMERLP